MKTVYEIYTQNGVEVVDVIPDLSGETWYRIRKHFCRNEEQLPCDPWELVEEHGDVPDIGP